MSDIDVTQEERLANAVDEAQRLADPVSRWKRLCVLLESVQFSGHRCDRSPVVAQLCARVDVAIEEMRTFIASAGNPHTQKIPMIELQGRLKRLRETSSAADR